VDNLELEILRLNGHLQFLERMHLSLMAGAFDGKPRAELHAVRDATLLKLRHSRMPDTRDQKKAGEVAMMQKESLEAAQRFFQALERELNEA